MTSLSTKKAHVLSSIEEMVRTSLGLDPSTEIIEQIVEVARELPDNANAISPSHAEYLAGRFLKGLALCNELCALATGYELKSDILKKKAHGDAFIVRSKSKGLKTAKEMEAYANTDDLYVEAAEKHAEAKMLRVLVENIRSDFEKAHYLMRKISEKDVENDYRKQEISSDTSDESGEEDGWKGFLAEDSNTTKNKRTPW